jgi:lipocalin
MKRVTSFILACFVAPYAPYKILETDYDTYAAVYGCIPLPFFKIEFAWILARQPTFGLDQAALANVRGVFQRNGVDLQYFKNVTQDCAGTYVLNDDGDIVGVY